MFIDVFPMAPSVDDAAKMKDANRWVRLVWLKRLFVYFKIL